MTTKTKLLAGEYQDRRQTPTKNDAPRNTGWGNLVQLMMFHCNMFFSF